MAFADFFAQPDELSKRLAIFYSASLTSGAFGGLLAVSISQPCARGFITHTTTPPMQGVITQYMHDVGNTPGWQWYVRTWVPRNRQLIA